MKFFYDKYRHLVCVPYSVKNLHKMAKELGIKKCWFHSSKHKHYDIPLKMLDEVSKSCILVSPKNILRIILGGDIGKPMKSKNPPESDLKGKKNNIKAE